MSRSSRYSRHDGCVAVSATMRHDHHIRNHFGKKNSKIFSKYINSKWQICDYIGDLKTLGKDGNMLIARTVFVVCLQAFCLALL